MKDNFSTQSDLYAQFRPDYPEQVFDHILQFVTGTNAVWDCATGNGQAAKVLATYFDTVYATDISRNQIDHAVKKENIVYAVQPAEQTNFPDNSFDLITVAQAIHWFDFEKFYAEVKRTLKNGGIIAILGYALIETEGAINDIILDFYRNIVGTYWDKERKYIDDLYQTIPFPFIELPSIQLANTYQWNLAQLTGYLETWSTVQHYKKANHRNPVDLIYRQLQDAWGNVPTVSFSFPILLRIGIHEK